jgi:hypothetical protein
VELVDEIPKPPSGKILRRLLRDDRATLARSDDEGGYGRLTLDLVPARVVVDPSLRGPGDLGRLVGNRPDRNQSIISSGPCTIATIQVLC